MSTPLSDKARAILEGTNYVTVATLEPDGQAQLSPVWAHPDGDDVVFATVAGRRKHRNLVRDPRVTLSVFDMDDPYAYVEIRGTATMTEEGGRELIDAMSLKYRGVTPYGFDGPDDVRILVRVTPERIIRG
jgi:PPOX class probable F420-dependent enzyme